ncbi:hypothetical protein XELAEV_18001055mg [Xenopus laevis]|nr:hypothetical protein XELAEV_18001055mg [Xenopus laevis]
MSLSVWLCLNIRNISHKQLPTLLLLPLLNTPALHPQLRNHFYLITYLSLPEVSPIPIPCFVLPHLCLSG